MENLRKIDKEILLTFIDKNPKYFSTVQKRVMSYWNEYYRSKYEKRESYPGFYILSYLNIKYEFDENLLKEKLNQISDSKKVLFALSCCERQLPYYQTFSLLTKWGDYEYLEKTLNEIWSNLLDGVGKEELLLKAEKIETLISDTEDFSTVYVSYSLNASCSVLDLLHFLIKKEISNIIDIASLARDTVDFYIQDFILKDLIDRDIDILVSGHPLMQKEIRRQDNDLEILFRNDLNPAFLRRFRKRVKVR